MPGIVVLAHSPLGGGWTGPLPSVLYPWWWPGRLAPGQQSCASSPAVPTPQVYTPDKFNIQTKENYTNSSISGYFCQLRPPWCLYQTGLRRNTTSSWRCRVVPAAGCLWAEHTNKLAEKKRCLKRGRWRTEAEETPVLSPFIRISSLGTVWNSLWYWELYLLTVCGGSEPRSQNSNSHQGRKWLGVLHPFWLLLL